jgi:hypothetical protein
VFYARLVAKCWNRQMNRGELVRRMVLNAMCDDYENIDQIILPEVARDCAKLGFSVERSEIVKAVGELVQDGLAQAYLLSGTEPFVTELQGMPPVDVVEAYFKTYFYITKKGTDFHLSDDTWWPFDDVDNVLPNWHLDTPPVSG